MRTVLLGVWASLRYCGLVGLTILPLTVVAQEAAGQEGMMRPRGEGMGMGGIGTGIAVGIGTGLLIDQLSKSGDANESKKVDKKTEKKLAKPKKDKPQNAKAPETPPAKQADNPPPKIPVENPIPPVAGPPSVPPTTDNPPNKTGSPPDVPPTQTATSPPDQPKTPGVPPEEPHDIPVPPTIYGHNKDEDCPQRGMGCAALIIDFQTHYLGDLEPLKDHLTANKGCEVEYVSTQFLSGKELAKANSKLHKNVNDFEWKRVNDAIDRHRQRVSKGADLAIEVVRGEGYPAELRSCGSVGPAEGRSLDRQEFHAGNYKAANKHVCGWVVTDFSCYSGYTPHVFDELNNRGSLPLKSVSSIVDGATRLELRERACQPAQTNDCSQHAAYDFDIAMGQSGSSLPACAVFTPALRDSLKGALVQKGSKIEFNQNWRDLAFGGYYSDGGYKHCSPVVRDGYKSELPPPPGKPETVPPVSAK